MGNHESREHGQATTHHTAQRQRSAPSTSSPHIDPSSPAGRQRSASQRYRTSSLSAQSQRYRHNSESSCYSYSPYSSSLEGGYSDPGDGMQPMTFGGDYKKKVTPATKPESFDKAHGNKLRIDLNSMARKNGSGFDLDWQYDKKKRQKVISQRSLDSSHPLYHKLTPKIVEEGSYPTSSSTTRGQM
ncbi:hypothetical protein RvY_10596 [Ramazzottius varieornatus]|uniref:Uncharacterized protein n=1 Tax=Ramazzottius varieornatus TaxID=947166 RepID=A0A1D1VMA8_RAMVA|nr:hypothetical protein RvY_10596 [Ramazzottius varieornatus]